jgi:signal peptidase I
MKKKKKPFEISDSTKKKKSKNDSSSRSGQSAGVAKVGFFSDPGVRETIESIVVAVILALLFRAYEAEAFVIPTGSMAPTLQGRHVDIHCEECGYNFRVGASAENPDTRAARMANGEPWLTGHATCPICRYTHDLDRKFKGWPSNKDSFYGDRIIVSKFAYELSDPERWDVIVFKYPSNPKQNYIKRLIGLPGETIKLEFGNVYVLNNETLGFDIARKPHHKLKAMLQGVDDTNFIAKKLKEVNWPSRWDEWSSRDDQKQWSIDNSQKTPTFSLSTSSDRSWLRYRHVVPWTHDWVSYLRNGELPPRLKDFKGQLISDFYAYNYLLPQRLNENYSVEDIIGLFGVHATDRYLTELSGIHWVPDLAVDSLVEIKSDSGELVFDIVKGGDHFYCTIDVATGLASLSCDNKNVSFVSPDKPVSEKPVAGTPIRGKGSYKIRYANVDDKLYLWVNEKVIQFDGPTEYENSVTRFPMPKYSADDPGDAEPIGIGGKEIDLEVKRLQVLRDVYYIGNRKSYDPELGDIVFAQEYRTKQIRLVNDNGKSAVSYDQFVHKIRDIFEDPLTWSKNQAFDLFSDMIHDRPEYNYRLSEDQFMPLGDNSPSSMDSRAWPHGHFFDRKFLIGKALFIYWPHAWRQPFFFPNFKRMGFIR